MTSISRRGIIAASVLGACAPLTIPVTNAKAAASPPKRIQVSKISYNENFIDDRGVNIWGGNGTGQILYCGQGYLKHPEPGDYLDLYGSLEIPELDYVMYHGYDGEEVTSVFGYTGDIAYAITGLAVWLAIADKRIDVLGYEAAPDGVTQWIHGNQYYVERLEQSRAPEGAKNAARRLYDDAVSYARSRVEGPEAGCAMYFKNNKATDWVGDTPRYFGQGCVAAYKTRSGKAKVLKSAKNETWV